MLLLFWIPIRWLAIRHPLSWRNQTILAGIFKSAGPMRIISGSYYYVRRSVSERHISGFIPTLYYSLMIDCIDLELNCLAVSICLHFV